MPLLTSARIVINTRTLRIGNQTYALNNLARVQIVELAKPSRAGKGDIKRAIWGGSGVYCVFTLIGLLTGADAFSGIGVLLAVGLGILIYQKTKEPYIPRYALVLETTGNPRTALVSTDRAELESVSVHITEAMENPPETEQIYTVHNVIAGDQYNLVGDHNIGKVGKTA